MRDLRIQHRELLRHRAERFVVRINRCVEFFRHHRNPHLLRVRRERRHLGFVRRDAIRHLLRTVGEIRGYAVVLLDIRLMHLRVLARLG